MSVDGNSEFSLPTTSLTIDTFSAYIHIPFCRARCGYCDFNTYTHLDFPQGASASQYATTLVREIEMSAHYMRRAGGVLPRFNTVFFGGGTPTMLPARDLAMLYKTLKNTFPIADDVEITTEANPETLTLTYVHELADAGFTRMSFGMQSAVASVLSTLDRIHTPGQVRRAVGWAKEAGLDASVDLIYGSPGETMKDWETSVHEAIDLGVDHVSAYALSLEPSTKMARQIRSGTLGPIDYDMQADFYERADEMLSAAGFRWYEISNWARPGHECKHNMAYWTGGNWWGYGPGAHSHLDGVRFWNCKHPVKWAQSLARGVFPLGGGEVLSSAERHDEDIMLGVRLVTGIDARVFTHEVIDELREDGLIIYDGGRISLTVRGRLLADYVTRTLWDYRVRTEQ